MANTIKANGGEWIEVKAAGVFGFDGVRREGAVEAVVITIEPERGDVTRARLSIEEAERMVAEMQAAIAAAKRTVGASYRWETV